MEENKEVEILEVDGVKYRETEVDGKTLRIFFTDHLKRLEFETFEEYKLRREAIKFINKRKSKGKMFWPSIVPIGKDSYYSNTYNKEQFENFIKEQENGEEQI